MSEAGSWPGSGWDDIERRGERVQLATRVTREQHLALKLASIRSGLTIAELVGSWLQALLDHQRGTLLGASASAASTDRCTAISEQAPWTHDEQCQCPGGCWGATSDDGGI